LKTITVHHIVLAGALALGLTASAAAQDRPPGPGAPQIQGSRGAGPRGPGGPGGADRQQRFAEMQHRREQRLHDLLQIKPDQENAFRAYVSAIEQGRPPRGPVQAGAPGERKPLTTPERLDREAQRIAQMQQRLTAERTFYGALTPEQKKAFDAMPMGGGGGFGGGRHWGGGPMPGPFRGAPPAR